MSEDTPSIPPYSPPTSSFGHSPGRPPRPKRSLRLLLVRAAAWFTIGGAALLLVLVVGSCAIVRIPDSGSRQTVLFYAAPTSLEPGARLDADELEDRLRRLAYHEVDDPIEPGGYRRAGNRFDIHLRPFQYTEGEFPGGRVEVTLDEGRVERLAEERGSLVDAWRLEPERIANFDGETGALLAPLALEDAPPLLCQTLISMEDRRFYKHPGIDPIGILRALFSDVRAREVGQGGSTLSQQLARSLFLHNKKTLGRKAQEAVLALGLEMRYSKEQILEAYLNAAYWGFWGPLEIRGAREAARYYLGKELDEVDAAGIALLVGLLPAPNVYSPYNSATKAKERRDRVLRVMGEQGILDEQEVKAALKRPIPSKRPPERPSEAAYFVDAARAEVAARAAREYTSKPGTRIFTTLDFRDQAAAQASLDQGLKDLEKSSKRLRRKKDKLQAACVVMDPATGEVSALIGGRDYLTGPWNRATEARRQPGSLFKPFVYLAAFRDPEREDGSFWSPASVVVDEPWELRMGRKVWRPQNYDKQNRGEVTVRTALEQSLNIPTAKVAQEVGIGNVAAAAADLGVASPLNPVPSLALGTSDVSLLEMTAAYSTLARYGEAPAPTLLRGILSDGRTVPLKNLDPPSGVEAPPAYLTVSLMRGVMETGTGKSARALGVKGVVAGKTGTTDDYRDAWFVGFSPKRCCGVWVGFDKKDAVGLSGSTAALPIWAGVMREIMPAGGDGAFRRPRGVSTALVCPETGMLGTIDCPDLHDEEFLTGTEPEETCDRHGDSFFRSMKRFFRL